MKCRSGIEIQSKIMILILILNRIFIFTKFCRATPHLVSIFSILSITFSIKFHGKILILILKKKKILKQACGIKLNFISIINI